MGTGLGPLVGVVVMEEELGLAELGVVEEKLFLKQAVSSASCGCWSMTSRPQFQKNSLAYKEGAASAEIVIV